MDSVKKAWASSSYFPEASPRTSRQAAFWPQCGESKLQLGKIGDHNLVNLFLTNYWGFLAFLIFQAIAVFSAHLLEGVKRLLALRKSRKTQKSSLISKEKVNKERLTCWVRGVFVPKFPRIPAMDIISKSNSGRLCICNCKLNAPRRTVFLQKFRTRWPPKKPRVRGVSTEPPHLTKVREEPDTFNFWRHVMRAILPVRPKCSHRCVSLKESPLKLVQVLQHAARVSTEQTSMRTKWFKHVAI